MLNFDPNFIIPPLAGQQPPELCSKYIFLYRIIQIFVDIFAKNMNGWSDKSKILCIEQSGRAEKNTRKQKISPSGRS